MCNAAKRAAAVASVLNSATEIGEISGGNSRGSAADRVVDRLQGVNTPFFRDCDLVLLSQLWQAPKPHEVHRVHLCGATASLTYLLRAADGCVEKKVLEPHSAPRPPLARVAASFKFKMPTTQHDGPQF